MRALIKMPYVCHNDIAKFFEGFPLNEEKHQQMVRHKKSAAITNKQTVFQAIQQLGKPSTEH